jgi:hypothetical protein
LEVSRRNRIEVQSQLDGLCHVLNPFFNRVIGKRLLQNHLGEGYEKL